MEMQVFEYTAKQKGQKSLLQLATSFGFLTLKERREPQQKERRNVILVVVTKNQIKTTFIVYLLMQSWENLYCCILQQN